MRLDTSAVTQAGEVDELPVSENAPLHYIATGSLLRYVADLVDLQHWRTEPVEAVLRWRSQDELGLLGVLLKDVMLLGGLRFTGHGWFVYPSPPVYWALAVDGILGYWESRIGEWRVDWTFSGNSKGPVTVPVGTFLSPGTVSINHPRLVGIRLQFAEEVGIIKMVAGAQGGPGPGGPITFGYELVEARVGSTHFGRDGTSIGATTWGKVKGGDR